MLQNAYFVAKIGADTAENEQHFAEILPTDRGHGLHGPCPRSVGWTTSSSRTWPGSSAVRRLLRGIGQRTARAGEWGDGVSML